MECISVVFHPSRESGNVVVKNRRLRGWPPGLPERIPWEYRNGQYVEAYGIPLDKEIQDFIKSKI